MPSLTRRILATLVAALTLLGVDAAAAWATGTVTVVNGPTADPWVKFDTRGDAIDAHDGEIKEYGGVYYLYGTAYGCGYVRFASPATPFCGFVVYSSHDLRHWTYRGKLFDPDSTSPTDWQKICNSATPSCYRPHVLYNFATHKYVLWVNTYDYDANGVRRGYHVLTSTSPVGGFTEARDASGAAVIPTLAYPTGGDFDIFQDNDSAHTGYIVYTLLKDPVLSTNYSYSLVVERLTADYTNGTGQFTTLDTRHTESPSMFKRGSTYYVTMSSPNCAYCGVRDGAGSGTATTYLTAPSPLGPWRGRTPNTVQLSPGRLYVSGTKAMFWGTNATQADTLTNLHNYDVRVRATPLPDTFAHRVHYAQFGWMFRASDADNGYYWVLSNRPYAGAPSRLTKYVLVDGRVIKKTIRKVRIRLSTTRHTLVRTNLFGHHITTWVKGVLVDKSWDNHYARGFAGIREFRHQPAYYDHFAVSRSPSLGYVYYGGDSFRGKTLRSWPAFARYRRSGLSISADSCGGQPADVAQLRGPTAATAVYLFQSDRWDDGDQNEAQALHYWEPLRFRADGSIEPLTCAPTSTMTLWSAPQSASLTTVAPTDTFTVVQDITAALRRAQLFTLSSPVTATHLHVVAFQSDDASRATPNAPLLIGVYDADAGMAPLWTTQVGPTTATVLPFTPTVLDLALPSGGLSLAAGHHYALILSTTSTRGRYGTVRSDGSYDVDPTGSSAFQTLDPSTGSPTAGMQPEPALDLRWWLSA